MRRPQRSVSKAGLVAACALLGAAVALAGNRPASAAETTKPAATSTAPAAATNPGPRGEYGVMIAVLKLEGAPLERFLEKYHAWEQEVATFHRGEKYRQMESLGAEIKKAREAKDEAKAASLEQKFKPLNEEYWAMRSRSRAAVILALPPELQQQWVAHSMSLRAMRAFKRADLKPEQAEKIKSFCSEEAALFMKEQPELIKDDPYLRTLGKPADRVIDRARLEVLDDAQREKVPSRGTIPPKADAGEIDMNSSQ